MGVWVQNSKVGRQDADTAKIHMKEMPSVHWAVP